MATWYREDVLDHAKKLFKSVMVHSPRSILAAVAEGNSDIVMLEGLTNVGRD